MNPLYSVAQIRAIESTAPGPLMERAGWCAAQAALKLLAPGAPVLVLAGPGNNGGDAFEVAAQLAQAGCAVSLLAMGAAQNYSADARAALQRAQDSAAQFIEAPLDENRWALVIDGLFGIGLTRPITGLLRDCVSTVNDWSCPVLALDVPSGLDADSGNIVGPDGVAIAATHTITFIGDKPGLHTCFGRDYAGQVELATLDIDAALYPAPTALLNQVELFAHYLRPRSHNSHKGSYGDVMLLGGAHGMAGAAILAARAAAKCGAGRVFAGFLDQVPLYDSGQPELMCRAASTLEFSAATLVVGPGMGISQAARDLLARALYATGPAVLDADALNLIASDPGLQSLVKRRLTPALLTPHPLEAARLLESTASAVQADRLGAARMLATRFNAHVVLKGSGSIIARPDGTCVINTTGNAGLATAGSGDVLSGLCGALLAQDWPCHEAALAAVWLHGRAADLLSERGVGPTGLTASELIPLAREILNGLIQAGRSGVQTGLP